MTNLRLKITHNVPRAEEGSCNFCTDHANAVTVVESANPQRHASIRFCAACFEALCSPAEPEARLNDALRDYFQSVVADFEQRRDAGLSIEHGSPIRAPIAVLEPLRAALNRGAER